MACRTLLLALLAALAACAAAKLPLGDDNSSGSSSGARAGPGSHRRGLLAVKEGGDAATSSMLRSDQPVAAGARLCALQCLQHACVSWHRLYMGEQGDPPAAAVPAAAAECLAQCSGVGGTEAACLAQTFQRLLNTQPLQYSCTSACITGLLHSACSQCGSSGGGCSSLQLASVVEAAECLVDAAP